jgi:hypothetical protein
MWFDLGDMCLTCCTRSPVSRGAADKEAFASPPPVAPARSA